MGWISEEVEGTRSTSTTRYVGGYVGTPRSGGVDGYERSPEARRITGGDGFTPYTTDSEWRAVSGWAPARIEDLKYALNAGGYLADSGFGAQGSWTREAAAGLRQLMEEGNATRRSWQDILGGTLSAPSGFSSGGGGGGGGGGGATRAPLQIQLSHPEDLEKAFRSVAQRMTGGEFISEKQVKQMVATYQSREADVQRKAYAGDSTITAPPSPEVFGEKKIEELDKTAVQANKFAGFTRVLMSLAGAQ